MTYTSTGRTNARHSSHKDGKTVKTQSPQINTVTDAVAGSSTPSDQSYDTVIRDTDTDMLENKLYLADRFSLFSQSDDDDSGEVSDYVPEFDSEVGFPITMHVRAVTFLMGV